MRVIYRAIIMNKTPHNTPELTPIKLAIDPRTGAVFVQRDYSIHSSRHVFFGPDESNYVVVKPAKRPSFCCCAVQ